MTERELAGVVLGEDTAPCQLLEGGDRLLLAPSAHRADETGVGRAAEHRRGGDDLPGDLSHAGHPRLEQAAHARRQRRVIGLGVEVLDDEERQTLCLLVQPLGELGRRPGCGCELCDVVPIQPFEDDDVGEPLMARVGEDAARRMIGRRLLRAPGHENENRPVAEPADEEGEHLERGRVRPVRVVDDQQAGRGAARCLREDARDAVEKTRLRAGSVERGRRRRPELGNETRSLGCRRGSDCSGVAFAQRAPHELDCATERKLGLTLDTTRRCSDASAGAHAGDELFGEPRLADPRLAAEDDESPCRADLRVRVEQRGELSPAPDERMRPRAHAAVSRRRFDGSCAPLADRAVDRGRLLRRRHAELAVERADAVAVLRERLRPLAALTVERDQAPVRGLVERVEHEPPSRVLDRAHPVAGRRAEVGEPVEDGSQLPAERGAPEGLPIVERAAVPQPEAGEEGPAVESRRPFEHREVVAHREPPELVEVEAHISGLERDGVAGDRHPAAAERRAQRRERPPQRGAAAVGRMVRPQELRERVAIVDAALHGQVREQRRRLARVHRQRDAVREHHGWAENIDRKGRGGHSPRC